MRCFEVRYTPRACARVRATLDNRTRVRGRKANSLSRESRDEKKPTRLRRVGRERTYSTSNSEAAMSETTSRHGRRASYGLLP